MSTRPPVRDRGPAIVFEQVTKRYDGVSAVDALSMSIDAGTFVALVGTSGSGKSTLMRMINRLDQPDQGCVRLDGCDVQQEDVIKLRRSIGYVFQNVGLFPHMTIAENIAIPRRIAGAEPVDIGAALERVGLPADFAGRLPAQLSGGQQQRVGIARALAGQASYLLMDEPFGALDPVTRDQLGHTCRRLHDELGLTTILVTHDMAEALLLADRVIVLARGRIVGDATPREMLAGKVGTEADAMMAVPRAQAARLAELGG
ncbi:ATP-binding cassette domain-containing protein [Sphingomonas sp. MMS24-J13]|uniref:ATP-binding cassette domain-containing protein n=1 Tax=Sphingomonas sp. MMS24-J13 TaxID=3238686 RepID=UPI00384DB325